MQLQDAVELGTYVCQSLWIMLALKKNFPGRFKRSLQNTVWVGAVILQSVLHIFMYRWTNSGPSNYLFWSVLAMLELVPAFFPYGVLCLRGDNGYKFILVLWMISMERTIGPLSFRLQMIINQESVIFKCLLGSGIYSLYALLMCFVRMNSPQSASRAMRYSAIAITLVLQFVAVTFSGPISYSANPMWIYIALVLLFSLSSAQFSFIKVIRQLERTHQMQLELEKTRIDRVKLEEANLLLNDTGKIRHEMKNHLFVMSSLLNEGNFDALKRYFAALSADYAAFNNRVYTGNGVVDAILNRKMAQMENLRILTHVTALLPARVSVRDLDMATVLFNLLDNAIEASESVEHPFIDVKIAKKNSYLLIAVQNRVKGTPLATNPTLKTTKARSHEHGIGLSLVRQVAERYCGSVSFSQNEDMFQASVYLINPTDEPAPDAACALKSGLASNDECFTRDEAPVATARFSENGASAKN